uniref:General stress protein 17M-like domain-containing protein n=1 Tax=mine drainage metagenome TaxID=410659 RepID=E6QLC8_9ZZZZ
MAGKNTAVFGIYATVALAETAADRLIASGFSSKDVSVLMADNEGSRQFATEKNTKAPEGATTGVTTGGIVGGTLGILAGIGTLAIPGVGPLIAAGPIMAGLAGLGIGGAVGGVVGALVGMGIPEFEAKRYEGRVKNGGVLLSAHCDSSDEVSRAKEVLKATGAEDISSAGEKSVSSHGVNTEAVDRNGVNRNAVYTEDVDNGRTKYVEDNRIDAASSTATERTTEPVDAGRVAVGATTEKRY